MTNVKSRDNLKNLYFHYHKTSKPGRVLNHGSRLLWLRIYIFGLNKKTHTDKKQKETKEEREKENVIVVNNICGKSNGIR